MSQWRSQSFGGGAKNSTGGAIPNAVKMFMNQQNKSVSEADAPLTSLDFVSSSSSNKESTDPLAALSSQQKVVGPVSVEKADKKSAVSPKILLASAGPGSAIPLTGSLVEAIKASAATNKKDSLEALLTKKSVMALEKITPVSADTVAAEEFMASLANPLFKQMPVDKSLVAALRSMNGGSVNAPSKKFEILTSLEKKKRKRRSTLGGFLLNHLMRRRDLGTMNKPIERSSMETPAISSTQQGPKLLDKIRDMGRVIATP